MKPSITRRAWLQSQLAAGLSPSLGAPRPAEPKAGEAAEFQIFWGDLHNHNSIGYAQGSLRRTFEIARSHLHFFAFTPHAHWPDISHYEGNIEQKWINGFAVTRQRFPEVIQMAREFDEPGRFVPIVGYEWHSTELGDFHILFPTLEAELYTPDDLKQLQEFARQRGCLMIPHHPANLRGHRGANPDVWDRELSPVLEIYSEWGNAEHDRAPYPYIRHTEGGRWTRNTYQYLLAQGYRLGAIASTDDHLGYPGAYREGLVAVLAKELSREAIFDALRRRRCYAVTGDRIEIDFRLNGYVMGSELACSRQRKIFAAVRGWDAIERVELVKNNRVVHREFPIDREPGEHSWKQPVVVRLEYGWGPWPALGMARTCDWDVTVLVRQGRLKTVGTCFQSGPLEEDRRDRILDPTGSGFRLRSFTALKQQFEDHSTKAVVLVLEATPETELVLDFVQPVRMRRVYRLGTLAESNEPIFTGPFPRESALLHRVVFSEHWQASLAYEDEAAGDRLDWYYLRVVQTNGQLAWSSPIWVEKRM